MIHFTRTRKHFLWLCSFIGLASFVFYSCQKADPAPYGIPAAETTPTVTPTYTTTTHDTNPPPAPDTNTLFLASVNASAIMSFTPNKSSGGGNTTLKGVNSFYTISITFPSSTGPGTWNIGFPSTTITAKVVNGATTYVVTDLYGSGQLVIDSVLSGRYYGYFSIDAQDTTSLNYITVTQGRFNHL